MQLLDEINKDVEAQVVQQDQKVEDKAPQKGKPKKNDFDDFFGGDDDDDMSDGGLIDFDSLPAAGPQIVSQSKEKKQAEPQKDDDSKTTEHQFLQIFDDLLLLVSEAEDLNS